MCIPNRFPGEGDVKPEIICTLAQNIGTEGGMGSFKFIIIYDYMYLCIILRRISQLSKKNCTSAQNNKTNVCVLQQDLVHFIF
jgi:hypothetical protein